MVVSAASPARMAIWRIEHAGDTTAWTKAWRNTEAVIFFGLRRWNPEKRASLSIADAPPRNLVMGEDGGDPASAGEFMELAMKILADLGKCQSQSIVNQYIMNI
jgi:hypothetical protein